MIEILKLWSSNIINFFLLFTHINFICVLLFSLQGEPQKDISERNAVAQIIRNDQDSTSSISTENEKFKDSLKIRRVKHVRGDGHCLIYAFVVCMSEYGEYPGKKDVIHALKQEITENYTLYCGFLPSNVEIDLQLQLFEMNRNYNMEICDTFLMALCNCFDVQIVVAEATTSMMHKLKYVVKPNNSTSQYYSERSLYLLRTGDHYDPLVC